MTFVDVLEVRRKKSAGAVSKADRIIFRFALEDAEFAEHGLILRERTSCKRFREIEF